MARVRRSALPFILLCARQLLEATAAVAPKIQDFSFPTHVALGKRAQVHCAVYEGDGPLTFFWTKDGVRLASGQETSIRQTTDLTSLLTLDSISAQSLGNYTCVVNGPGGSDSYTATLSVKGVPKVHSAGFPADLTLGDETGAHCVVRKDDSGPVSILWMKDGVELEPNDRITVTMVSTSSSTLAIRRIEHGDVGNYTCIASSMQGSSEVTVPLIVRVAPKLQEFFFPSHIALGKKAQVSCVVYEGNGPFTFTWKKDGLPLEHGPGTAIRQVTEATSLLMLDAVTVGDIGNYTCVVSSGAGSDSYTAALHVKVSILWRKDDVEMKPNDRITVTMVSMSSSTLAITRIELGDLVAPKLQEFFFPSHIALGKKAQVYCAVYEGNGPFSFSWKKDGLPLDPAPGTAIRQVTESTSLLILDAVAVGDIGNYTCVVSSGAGSDSYTASLHVKDAPKVHSAGFPPDLTLGDETAVHCVVKKAVTGPVLLSWRKDGADVQSNDRLTVSRPTASSSMISIRRIEPEDVGNYTCTASSVQGSSEVMVPLVVIGPLKVHSFGFPPDLRLGGETGAFCVLTKEAPGPVSISWFKDGVKLDSGGRVTVVVQTSSSTLTIKRIEPGDIGNYTCVADSAEGSGEVTVPLTVLVAPKLQEFSFSSQTAMGKRAQVTCAVLEGDGPFDFSWTKDGSPLGRRTTVRQLTDSSLLSLDAVVVGDIGNYTCVVSSPTGRDSYTAVLSVKVAPKLQDFAFSSQIAVGKKAQVHCAVLEGDGPFDFSWTKDGSLLGHRATVRQLTDSSVLSLDAVVVGDIGNYTCVEFAFSSQVTIGKRAQVHCAVFEGDGPFEFSWLKDGTPLGHGVTIRQLTESSSLLTLDVVTVGDIGNYTCVVSSPTGSDSYTAVLSVKEPPKLREFSFPDDLSVNEETTLNCFVRRGTEPYRFAWFKNAVPLVPNDRMSVAQVSGRMTTLTFRNVSPEDMGNYTCQVSNPAGKDAVSATLHVTGPPKIHSTGFSPDLSLGDDTAAVCVAKREAGGSLSIMWQKDGVELKSDSQITVSHTASSSTLTIRRIRPEDVGNYTCTATNADGSNEVIVPLVVIGTTSPQSFGFPSGLVLGEDTVAVCFVKGISSAGRQMPPSMSWWKDNREIQAGARLSLSRPSPNSLALSIRDLRPEDVGNYTCAAVGLEGVSGNVTVALVVVDLPKPQSLGFPTDLGLGDEAVVTCFAKKSSSLPANPLSLSWHKDGAPISSEARISLVRVSQNSLALSIKSVLPEDIGNYTCVAEGPTGSSTVTVPLVVSDVSLKPQSLGFPSDLAMGNDAVATCFVRTLSGQEAPVVSWVRNGVPIRDDGRRIFLHKPSPSSVTLAIRDVRPDDVGNYTCLAGDADGTRGVNGVTVPLLVTDLPKPQSFGFPTDLGLGDEAVVTCFAKKSIAGPANQLSLSWRKDGAPISPQARISLARLSQNSLSLSIKSVLPEDIGNYTCVAEGPTGSSTVTVPLLVSGVSLKPQSLGFPSDLAMGNDAVATCFVRTLSGQEAPVVSWLRNDVPIRDDGRRISLLRPSPSSVTLAIRSVRLDDIGNYTCLAGDANDAIPKPYSLGFPPNLGLGDEAVAACFVKRKNSQRENALDVFWSKGDRLLTTGTRVSQVKTSASSVTLSIRDIQAEDVANYTCTVRDTEGSHSITVPLIVSAIRTMPKPYSLGFPSNLGLGDEAVATCFLTKASSQWQSSLTVSWMRGDHELTPGGRLSLFKPSGSSVTLNIRNIQPEDVGNYTCAVRDAERSESVTVPLVVAAYYIRSEPCSWSGRFDHAVSSTTAELSGIHAALLHITTKPPNNWLLATDSRCAVHNILSSKGANPDLYVGCAESYQKKKVLCIILTVATVFSSSSLETGGTPTVHSFGFPPGLRLGGETVALCVLTKEGSGPVSISWFKDGEKLDSSDRITLSVQTSSSTLTIRRIEPGDIGNYTCIGHSAQGSSKVTIPLTVLVAPKLQDFSFSSQTAMGKRAQVTCAVLEGDGPFDFSWTKDGSPLGRRTTVRQLTDSSLLSLDAVVVGDIGNYTCVVSSPTGRDSYTAVLSVKGTPKVHSFGFPPDLILGDETGAHCVVRKDATGSVSILWRKDGVEMKSNDRITVSMPTTSSSTLTIRRIEPGDIGNYTCIASSVQGSSEVTVPLTVTVAPKLQDFAFSSQIAVGKKAQVHCAVLEGDGPFDFSWTKDGSPLGHRATVRQLTDSSVLSLDAVVVGDIGNYTCVVSSPTGSDSYTAALSVKGTLKVHSFGFPPDLILGDEAGAHCAVRKDGSGSVSILWRKDDVEVESNDRITVSMPTTSSSMLTIRRIEPGDIGNYTCVASSVQGSSEVTVPLTVTVAPNLQEFAFSSQVTIGKRAQVHCAVFEGDGPFEFSWLKDGTPLGHGVTIRQLTESSSLLTLDVVTVGDIGNYTCVVSSPTGSDSYTAVLSVKEPPKLRELRFPDDLSVNEETTLNCYVRRGTEPYRFAWFKNEVPLVPNDRMSVAQVSGRMTTLTFRSVSPEDVGNYTCQVSNPAGKDTVSATLHVTGPPKIHSTGFSPDLSLGDDTAAVCVAKREAGGSLSIMWQKDGVELKSVGQITVFHAASSSTLTVRQIRPEDIGNYTCTATNAEGSNEVIVPLVVLGTTSPQSFGFPSGLALGEDTVAVCFVKGISSGDRQNSPSMSWWKDGQEIQAGARLSLSRPSPNSITLTIRNLRPEDIGNYTCSAAGVEGIAGNVTVPLVVVDVPKPQSLGFPTDLGLGDEAVVTCFAKKSSSLPANQLSLSWHKDGAPISSEARISLARLSRNSLSLSIKSVLPEDIGNYTCVAEGPTGSSTVTVPLLVSAVSLKPQSLGFPSDLAMGNDAVATCFVRTLSGQEAPVVSWVRNDVPIRDDGRRIFLHKPSPSSVTLAIRDVRPDDVGNYTCLAGDADGTRGVNGVTVPLLVTDLPKPQSFGFPTDLGLGDEAVVTCFAKKSIAGPANQLSLSWRKDGAPISPQARISLARLSQNSLSLSIKGVLPEDIGNYTCVAEGPTGSSTVTVPLHVSGLSLKPQSLGFPSDLAMGNDAVATCFVRTLSGQEAPVVSWLRNDVPIRDDGRRISLLRPSPSSVTLAIRSVRLDDIGNYTCLAGDANDAIPKPYSLGFPPNLGLGDEAVAACFVKRKNSQRENALDVFWSKGDRLLTTGTRVSQVKTSASSVTLSIRDIQAEDVANYTCTVRDTEGSHSITVPLIVSAIRTMPKPYSLGFPSNLGLGDEAVATCFLTKASSQWQSSLTVSWMRGDHELTPGGRLSLFKPSGSSVTLNIRNIQPEDVGNYTCAVRDAERSESVTVPLVVAAVAMVPRPYSMGFPPNLGLGDEAIASCFLKKASPRWQNSLVMSWTRGDRELTTGGRVSLLKASGTSLTLSIRNIQPEDVGNYTCTVQNGDGSESITVPLVVSGSPGMQPFRFPAELSSGDTAAVNCIVRKGTTVPFELTWKKDGRPVENTHRVVISRQSDFMSTLTVRDVTPEDNGNYTCHVRNTVGSDEYSAPLAVEANDAIPKPYSLGFPPNLGLGDEAVAACFVKRKNSQRENALDVFWSKGDRLLTTGTRVSQVKTSASSVTLSIRDIQAEDVANYTCIVRDTEGSQSITVPLIVSAIRTMPKPYSLGFPSNLGLGDEAVATCFLTKASSQWQSSLTVSWMRGDHELTPGGRLSLYGPSGSSVTLSIRNIQPEDVGNYTCAVRDAERSESVTVPLVVAAVAMVPRPYSMGFPPNLGLGDEAIASCFLKKASPRWQNSLVMSWTRGDRELTTGGRVSLLKASGTSLTLSIRNIQPEDVGNYTCTVRNGDDSESITVPLVVSGSPGMQPFRFPAELSSGDTAAVNCIVRKGTTVPFELTWKKDGRPVENTHRVVISRQSDFMSTLTVRDVTPEDNGNYTCHVRNTVGSDEYSAPLAVEGIPVLQPFKFPTDLSIGEDALFTCVVKRGKPPYAFRWLKNGQELLGHDRILLNVMSQRLATMAIPRIVAEDNANYSCVVSNDAGTDAITASLVITGVPKIHEFRFPSDLSVGETVVVNCVVRQGSAGPFQLSWRKDGGPIDPAEGVSVSHQSDAISTLTVRDVSPTHNGNYSCHVRNAAGSDEYAAFLAVRELPKIQAFSFSPDLSLGDTTMVTCAVKRGSEAPHALSWLKNGREIGNGEDRVSVARQSDTLSTLTLRDVDAEDVGNYTCVASNARGADRFTASLTMTALPVLQEFSFSKNSVLGGTSVVSCIAVAGTRPFSFTWFHDGNVISSRDRGRVTVTTVAENVALLTINKISPEDVGNYSCMARNVAGVSTVSATLYVE
ncbi:hypothetical protein ISCGN_024113, partial [Ixodes scapularis]